MDNRISVVINTYNAERYLREVLESVKDFDEILICDMESTDSTLDIAKEFGCRVVTFPRGEHRICEPARDFAIHSAAYDYVLLVDADEVVPSSLKEHLYGLAKAPEAAAYAIPRINTFMGKLLRGLPDYQLRFFKKDLVKWPPIIHARPEVYGSIKNLPDSEQLSLIHLDNPTVAERIKKMNTYSDYEVPKRIHKNYSTLKMIFRPVWFFIREYFIGKGFKEGRRGIVKAYMASIYQMMLLSKVTEAQLNDEQSSTGRKQ